VGPGFSLQPPQKTGSTTMWGWGKQEIIKRLAATVDPGRGGRFSGKILAKKKIIEYRDHRAETFPSYKDHPRSGFSRVNKDTLSVVTGFCGDQARSRKQRKKRSEHHERLSFFPRARG